MKKAEAVCSRERRQAGFTLMEMLIAVFVVSILLAVSMIAVIRHNRYLAITELDNSSREIFMAAQNRAILLANNGQLADLVIRPDHKIKIMQANETASSITLYYIKSDYTAISKLLPGDAIEYSLWEGEFYIVYEPLSASITDVFYARSPFASGDFKTFYDAVSLMSQNTRMNQTPMFGHYGGEAAEGERE